MTTVVRNRLTCKSAVGCFIDFQKAFDFGDHDILQYELQQIGVNGKFYQAVTSTYKAPAACVKVNKCFTDWFPTPSGVKQEDVLLPTLFAIFMKDLTREVKQLGKGVLCGNIMVNILLYVNNVILLSESEEDLQTMHVLICGVRSGDYVLIKRKQK